MGGERLGDIAPAAHRCIEERFGLQRGGRQHRLERRHQHAEQIQALGADRLQFGVGAFLLGDHPRLGVVDVLVGFVGQRHGQADGSGRVVALVSLAHRRQCRDEAVVLGRVRQHVGQLAVEALGDETGAAAGQVDELADQVGIHAGGEVRQVQVKVVHAAGGLGREVVAQRFRCQAGIQVGAGHDEGAARLAHLGAVHGQVAVDVQPGRRAQAGAMQHRRPEQAVEIDDVLAEEVVQLGAAVGGHHGLEVVARLGAQVLEAGQVADRRVQPHVEILARGAGDFEAEVGRVTRDVPRAQAAISVEPFGQLGLHAGQGHVAGQPLAQEILETADFEEVVLRIADFRGGTGDHRLGVDQVGRAVGGAADFAVVAVLVGRLALGAGALDVAIRQEHALGRVIELRHRAAADMAGGVELVIQRLGQLAVGGRVGRVVMVEIHAERGKVTFVTGLDVGDEGFRRHAGLLGGQHDRRAMGVIGADVPDLLAHQPARAHPDIGLDVANQVTQVQRAVGIGQGVGDERGTGHGHRLEQGNAGLSHARKQAAPEGRGCGLDRGNWGPGAEPRCR
ncbi:hypothetical protein D3C71_1083510 [compost metagenome]